MGATTRGSCGSVRCGWPRFRGDCPSRWPAIGEGASKLAIGSTEMLGKWVRRAEIDAGDRHGLPRHRSSIAEVTRCHHLRWIRWGCAVPRGAARDGHHFAVSGISLRAGHIHIRDWLLAATRPRVLPTRPLEGLRNRGRGSDRTVHCGRPVIAGVIEHLLSRATDDSYCSGEVNAYGVRQPRQAGRRSRRRALGASSPLVGSASASHETRASFRSDA